MKKKRLVVSFELLSFGTKHGAALLSLKHYRIGDARIFLFSKSLLSSSVYVGGFLLLRGDAGVFLLKSSSRVFQMTALVARLIRR